jgi:hypothetical protein
LDAKPRKMVDIIPRPSKIKAGVDCVKEYGFDL